MKILIWGDLAVVLAFLYFQSVLCSDERRGFIRGSDKEALKTQPEILQNAGWQTTPPAKGSRCFNHRNGGTLGRRVPAAHAEGAVGRRAVPGPQPSLGLRRHLPVRQPKGRLRFPRSLRRPAHAGFAHPQTPKG